MIWSKVVEEEVVRRDWIMCINLKVEYIGFADRLDDNMKEREESVITKFCPEKLEEWSCHLFRSGSPRVWFGMY